MCGIFAYTGNKKASPILLEGLSSLEYRGYDSAGMFVAGSAVGSKSGLIAGSKSGAVKASGAVEKLRAKKPESLEGTSGIAHLRWATHGEPTETNAHPHSDCKGNVWVVHNGIIENFTELKNELIKKGHKFSSETDTEVIAHLIEHNMRDGVRDDARGAGKKGDFESAVVSTLKMIKGTYGLAISCKDEPDKIIAARMGAPVVIGLGDKEQFIASDISPILRHTKNIMYLRDGDIAVLLPNSHHVYNLSRKAVKRDIEIIDWNTDTAQKNGYEHFMMKEIMEGPEVVTNTIRGRLVAEKGLAKLGGLESVADRLCSIKRIVIVGCGTAYYAGMVGKYMIEDLAGIPVEIEVGSEFRYRKPIIDKDTAILAVSQSGETADTLEAVYEGKRKGALTLGIVNVVGSTLARETDAGIYNHAGPEIGVASTKAFISQLTALATLALFLGRQRNLSATEGKKIAKEIATLPEKMKKILSQKETIKKCAAKYAKARDFLYIGRKYNYPIAFEGALKLKEVSYIHAEGYGAGEMKHGPLAMIDKDFPTIAIATSDSVYEKMLSNIQEIRARKGPVIAIATEGNKNINKLVDDVIYVPETIEMLSPILSVVPLQLFAYYIAHAKKLNVDRPRNLAKSVTVE